jgi:hypothetical protein
MRASEAVMARERPGELLPKLDLKKDSAIIL